MREVVPNLLWLGHAGDIRGQLPAVVERGIVALVDLAMNEPVPPLPRELVYLRYPLIDGGGNPPELLRAAVDGTAALIAARLPTLVCCAAGLSRSLAIAALAWTRCYHESAGEALRRFASTGPHDLAPLLWNEALAACGVRATDL